MNKYTVLALINVHIWIFTNEVDNIFVRIKQRRSKLCDKNIIKAL